MTGPAVPQSSLMLSSVDSPFSCQTRSTSLEECSSTHSSSSDNEDQTLFFSTPRNSFEGHPFPVAATAAAAAPSSSLDLPSAAPPSQSAVFINSPNSSSNSRKAHFRYWPRECDGNEVPDQKQLFRLVAFLIDFFKKITIHNFIHGKQQSTAAAADGKKVIPQFRQHREAQPPTATTIPPPAPTTTTTTTTSPTATVGGAFSAVYGRRPA